MSYPSIRRVIAAGALSAVIAVGVVPATAQAQPTQSVVTAASSSAASASKASSWNDFWQQLQNWLKAKKCSIPVTPGSTTFTPCPTKLTWFNQIQIADGQFITINPGFDNQFKTPIRDGKWLAVMLDGRFVGFTQTSNGGMVMVQPNWPDVTRGKQRIAFYDTNSRLVGWDWINVDWDW